MNRRTHGFTATAGMLLILLHSPAAIHAGSSAHAYDEAGRLIGSFHEDGTTISYLYDPAGNLLRRTIGTFIDTDGNGIDDDWEIEHFEEKGIDPGGNSDRDGMTNLEEFLAGTDPNDAKDFLRVTEVATEAGDGFTIEWATVPGKLYRIQYTDTLNQHDWRDLPGDVMAEGTSATKTDLTASESVRRFYRVVPLH